MKRHLLAAAAIMWSSVALAGPSAEATRAALEGRGPGLEQAAHALRAAPADDAEARFGEGMLLFARAVETYLQAQYRHGFRVPPGLGMVPFLRSPLPVNPKPQPLDYAGARAMLASFLAALDAARDALGKVSGEVKMRLDVNAIALDLDGTGDPARRVTLGAVIEQMRRGPNREGAPPAAARDWTVAFDRADALWLEGYCNLLGAGLDFALAHDWSLSFGVAGPRFYAGARGILSGEAPSTGVVGPMGGRDDEFGDAIAFVHSIRWPVVEPRRMASARDRLLRMIALSRASWKEILAETDDEREWIPSPRQKDAAVAFAPVTEVAVAGWLETLDDFEAALTGRKLVGHWRLKRGFDLSKVFSEPRPFDLALWFSGHAAAPYLADGPTLSREEWRKWNALLGGNFLGYAIWFN